LKFTQQKPNRLVMPNQNQHWIPKFLVKNFTDADGRVYCLNIQTDTVTKPPPKYAACRVGFNDFQIDGETISFEDELEKIETQAAPVIKRIETSKSLAWLTEKQKRQVADFMAAQSFRTDTFYKGMDIGSSRQDFGPLFTELWQSAFLVAEEVARRQWALMVIGHDDVFYLGDHPLVLQLTENPSAAAELGFDVEGVEAFIPLAPKCALYMPCVSVSQQILSGYENAQIILGEPRITGYQLHVLELSQRVSRNAKPLYDALTTGVPLTATSENVENLNYLQCYWAHAAIYSNRRDFSFAKHVFSRSPQYRKTPKVSIKRGVILIPC
jgi:Protein of unknown function (DUF4238)